MCNLRVLIDKTAVAQQSRRWNLVREKCQDQLQYKIFGQLIDWPTLNTNRECIGWRWREWRKYEKNWQKKNTREREMKSENHRAVPKLVEKLVQAETRISSTSMTAATPQMIGSIVDGACRWGNLGCQKFYAKKTCDQTIENEMLGNLSSTYSETHVCEKFNLKCSVSALTDSAIRIHVTKDGLESPEISVHRTLSLSVCNQNWT